MRTFIRAAVLGGPHPPAVEAESARTSKVAMGATAAVPGPGGRGNSSGPTAEKLHWPPRKPRHPEGKQRLGPSGSAGRQQSQASEIHFTTRLGPQRAAVTGEVGAFLGGSPQPRTSFVHSAIQTCQTPPFAGHLGSDTCRWKCRKSSWCFPSSRVILHG